MKKFGYLIKAIKKKPNELEKCVSCNTLTTVTFNTLIQQRQFYIEGSGQLCKTCYESIYNK